jgi:hypothetical protein
MIRKFDQNHAGSKGEAKFAKKNNAPCTQSTVLIGNTCIGIARRATCDRRHKPIWQNPVAVELTRALQSYAMLAGVCVCRANHGSTVPSATAGVGPIRLCIYRASVSIARSRTRAA